MSKLLSIKFEKAVRFLAEHLPVSDDSSRKPILFHDIRVGVYLYENGHSEDTVLAGVLHDAIEWSRASEEEIRGEFGDDVLKLVLANTKDDSIEDKDEKINELIGRCVQAGQEALIVKAGDILDGFKWYSSQNDKKELQYCIKNAKAILEHKPEEFDDKIFIELGSWMDKF